jgi:small subunit ribosomal protein S14
MRYLIEKDYKIRKVCKKYEWKRMIIRAMLKCPYLSKTEWNQEWRKIPLKSSIVRVRNRCVKSGRAGSIYRQFKLSRMCLREEGNQGRLPGVERASW